VSRTLVDLVAPPFCGHLHPILGIGRRLALDHDVRVISTPAAQASIARSGLPGRALLEGCDAAIDAIVNPAREVGSHPLRLNDQLRRNLALMGRFREELAALWQARRPDLVIADFTLPVAGCLATERGLPWWTTLPSPCVLETPDGPPAYLGGLSPRPGVVGRVRDALGRALVRGFKRGVHALHRKRMRQLGVVSLYRDDGSEAIYSPERVLALGTPEIEFPRRWPSAVELVGPVLYTPEDEGPEPPFRSDGPHVLVTLGTHLRWLKDTAAEAVRGAARERDGNFHRLGYVPYARDLARYALVVHHGGAGVMYHCLRAGRPALVFPVDYDQFDHAARLVAAGVGWRLRRLQALPGLVERALADPRLAEACRHHQALLARYAPEASIAEQVARRLGEGS
jgi:UDP:flavonoid glycosyltransferase YjiC (YdhE family)